jgi:phospholipid:diacylglycerol acyltransferase
MLLNAYGPNCLLYLLLAGFDAYPSFSEIPEANLSGMECGLPTQLSFSAREIADGTFFKAIEDYDPDSKRLLYRLEK